MKAYKILIFIFAILTTLGVVCYFYPADGIAIGKANVRFVSLNDVLTGGEPELPEVEIKKEDTIDYKYLEACQTFEDSLEKMEVALVEREGNFYFPNDDVAYFDKVFAAMEAARGKGEILRVLHYGDSQIEMDRISGDMRSFFQRQFGGGGPGMVPFTQTVASCAVNQSSSGNATLYTTYGEGSRCNGNYGIMAKCYRIAGGAYFNASATRNSSADARVKRFSDIKVLYNNRAENFSAVLKANDRRDTCQGAALGIHCCRWHLDSACTSLNITFNGSADIYGIMLDDGPGVAVDNIPMRGSAGDVFTKITDTLLTSCYKQANVGLIILQYGGNAVPSISSEKGVDYVCSNIEKQIRYLRRCYPRATLLFIGPSDMSTKRNGKLRTYPLLPKLIDKLKSTCLNNGVAFWDIYEVMGGENSMIAWVKNGLAGPDYIHFTPAGARKVGKTLTNNFEAMYEYYKVKKNPPKPSK